jgi:DNA modification methylase
MQKDESLCRFLVEKFSFPGELCVDLCGCSGSFSIAAAQSRREWIYCESNKSNFDFGLARIGKALGYLTAKTA